MSLLSFEHPLNEKSRAYLRFETLFSQLAQTRSLDQAWQHMAFFKALFELIELLERCDLRTDLVKDLERQQTQLRQWSHIPNVDQKLLAQLDQQIGLFCRELPKATRLGSKLREDRFLSSIRQRFSIPGGTCSFDLPTLHYWLQLPLPDKHRDISHWLSEIQLLVGSVRLLLQLQREQAQFKPLVAKGGFYQGVEEGAELLRLKISKTFGFYPTVSGHKHRFAIRFIPFHAHEQEPCDLPFELACC